MPLPLRATYRLQLHSGFTFADAEAVLPYLARLGISHLYLSPILAARPGSTHGYDGTDPRLINPELGGEAGFRALSAAAHAQGLGIILDIVPNHLAVDMANPLWMEALEFGAAGPAGTIFDIDWARGRVTVPALGQTFADSLEAGEITLGVDWAAGRILARYYEQAWPLRPETVAAALQIADAEDEGALSGLSRLWLSLDGRLSEEAETVARARQGLSGLDARHRAKLEDALSQMDVAGVLARQHWRLTHWRAEVDRLTYRRFFNITGLIGLRVEDPAVFDLVHAVPLGLLREGLIEGLRVDHIDGLSDPAAYCRRLRDEAGPEAIILIEKILARGEPLRDWPITGTTGYERLQDIQGLFVEPDGFRTLDRYLVERRLLAPEPAARLAAAKALMLRRSFAGEVEALAELARIIMEGAAEGPEFGPATLREAVIALLVHCPVYRAYGADAASDAADAAIWQQTMAALTARDEPWAAELAGRLLARLQKAGAGTPEETFLRRFQQLSGPAMAKGLEDTEFYRSVALAATGEVGGDLAAPWLTPAAFHAIQENRAAARAADLIPLATHDTKRGAATRARIAILAEDAAGWIARFEAWHAQNKALRTTLPGGEAPDPLDEWLIYQTLLGAWPISEERLAEFLTKAMREAKRHSFWDHPNEAYEAAVQAFGRALLREERAATFRQALGQLVAEIDPGARSATLSATILQMTLPGTPDIYQGTELWDFTLVDPDNRRPVDYPARAAMLETAEAPRLAQDKSGETRLRWTRALLALRQESPALFARGDYRPLDLPAGWLGFTRSYQEESLAVMVPIRSLAARPAPPLPSAPAGKHWQILAPLGPTGGAGSTFPGLVAQAR
ncbi:malto-oligosyltrehalose synthase [Acidisoma sp. C75]